MIACVLDIKNEDVCNIYFLDKKYENTHYRLFLNVCLMLGTILFLSCGGGDDSPLNENDQREDDGQKKDIVGKLVYGLMICI